MARHGGKHRAAVVDIGNPAVIHMSKAAAAVGCKDEEVLKRFMALARPWAVSVHPFSAHMLLRFTSRGITKARAGNGAGSRSSRHLLPPPGPDVMQQPLATLDQQPTALYASLPPRTRRLSSSPTSEWAIRSGTLPEDLSRELRWIVSDARDLEEGVTLAKRGLLSLGFLEL
ncbi:hypothetical protein FB45DRAFT_1018900 [Roridomyces roridus]|uniref:Uncharacterized protein n=1 Tax=Roridomyces roridus TaxID=1738132 RepID=A0AAD7CDR4_9AGAR|nr:hypothetical protein FB45DRAFT_1018900 [Roridomyces roridus]